MAIFWSTPKLDDWTRVRLERRIADLLHSQLAIIAEPTIEDKNGNLDPRSIGYVYGYAKAFLSANHDIDQTETASRVTAAVLHILFPRGDAAAYGGFLACCFDIDVFASGRIVGEREYHDLNRGWKTVSMGLAQFIVDLRHKKVETAQTRRIMREPT